MDHSSVLRQQSQNTILRTFNEQNIKVTDTKSSKPLRHNQEYQDPGASAGQRGPPHPRPAVSRLPVLAKSLPLQTPKNFTQSHCKWENKPLSGKVRSKKPCTRPVPFNLSQPKPSRIASENQPPNTNSTRLNTQMKNIHCSPFNATNIHVKHSTTLKANIKSTKSNENASETQKKSRHINSHKTPASASKPSFALDSKENIVAAEEACSENMNLLSLKDTASIPKGDKVEDFQYDHAALLRILRNEGESAALTPHGKPNHLPQRVSIMKSRQKTDTIPHPGSVKSVQFSRNPAAVQSITKDEGLKAGLPSGRAPSIYTPMRVPAKKNDFDTGLPGSSMKIMQFSRDLAAMQSITKDEGLKAGVPSNRLSSIYTPMRVPVKKSGTDTGPRLAGSSMKTVQFSPDAAALRSILQNEGVKTVAPDGGSLRNSVCPTVRGTSICMAQRVSVRRNLADPSTVLMGPTLTPGQKWTAQRVTRPKPMSAMRWHTLSQQSPYGSTPGFRNHKENVCTNKEEVVQKLFVEDEQTPDEEAVTELLQDHTTNKQDMQSPVRNEEAKDDLMKEEDLAVGPFVQALQRESVIFFTGKKLFRDPHFKKTVKKDNKEPGLEELPVLHQSGLTSAPVQSVTKDLTQKKDVMNPAWPMQLKRFLPFEELRPDEEVATYTSTFVPSKPEFPQRCGNPLATLLHFEEVTRFVPISLDMLPISPLER